MKALPPLDLLRRELAYCPITGALRWLRQRDGDSRGKARLVGGRADRPGSGGYRRVFIPPYGYFRAHRIAFALHYGRAPADEIDHVNGIRSDNRAENLREATRIENGRNRAGYGRLAKGVNVDARRAANPYQARIQINGRLIALGVFATEAAAASAYAAAAREHFGAFARGADRAVD